MANELKPNVDDELSPTTVQITKATSRKLAQLAQVYRRSKAKQVAFMVDIEMERLAQYKFLPVPNEKLLPAVNDA